jgi:hypothetical protein
LIALISLHPLVVVKRLLTAVAATEELHELQLDKLAVGVAEFLAIQDARDQLLLVIRLLLYQLLVFGIKPFKKRLVESKLLIVTQQDS